jgi:hypothetical protein
VTGGGGVTSRPLTLLLCLAATACANLPTAVADEPTDPAAEPVEVVIQERIQVSDRS